MSSPDHPIWRLLQTVVYLIAGGVFLWMNATSFDAGEITTLVELGLLMFGVEGVKDQIRRRSDVKVNTHVDNH